MASSKGKFANLPLGIASFVYLDRLDPKYGNRTVTISYPVDSPEAKAVMALFDEFAEDNFLRSELKNPKFNKGYRVYEATEQYPARLSVSAKTKPDYEVGLFDAKGDPLPLHSTKVGSGSRLVVAVKLDQSKNSDKPGVMVRLNGVQVANLVERKDHNFSDISSDVEDAYVADADAIAEAKAERSMLHQKRNDAEKDVDASDDLGSAAEF